MIATDCTRTGAKSALNTLNYTRITGGPFLMKLRVCHWENNFVLSFYFILYFSFLFVLCSFLSFLSFLYLFPIHVHVCLFTKLLHLNFHDAVCLASTRLLKVEAEVVTMW